MGGELGGEEQEPNLVEVVKVFGWRACQNILPTRENLLHMKIIEDSSCELCQQDIELVLHVLWGCGVAQDLWAGCEVCLEEYSMSQMDMLQLVEDLMDRLTVDEFELFLV